MPLAEPPVSDSSSPAVDLRLSSPAQVLAAVPHLLGFAPDHSLVVISLRDKRVGLTMRMDLDASAKQLREIVLERLEADAATGAVLVLYDPAPDRPGRRPGASLARMLVRELERRGLSVKDALGVRDGRYWSYQCSNPACCPPAGLPLPVPGDGEVSAVAATFVASGSAPHASREELLASIAPVQGRYRRSLEAAYEEALNAPAFDPLGRWRVQVQRRCAGPVRPRFETCPVEAVRLITSLSDVAVRDAILAWSSVVPLPALLTLLRELAPLALPPYDAQLLATLGFVAYSFGDGALAAAALEQALESDPTHSLARLLLQALDGGINPQLIRGAAAELTELSASATVWRPDAR